MLLRNLLLSLVLLQVSGCLASPSTVVAYNDDPQPLANLEPAAGGPPPSDRKIVIEIQVDQPQPAVVQAPQYTPIPQCEPAKKTVKKKPKAKKKIC